MFVMRNEDGQIVGVFANLQPELAEEYLEPESVELSEFYGRLNHKKDNPNA